MFEMTKHFQFEEFLDHMPYESLQPSKTNIGCLISITRSRSYVIAESMLVPASFLLLWRVFAFSILCCFENTPKARKLVRLAKPSMRVDSFSIFDPLLV